MRSTVIKWAESVPDDFRFTFKISKTITHPKELKFAVKDINDFIATVENIGDKKGCLLGQFPPSLKIEKLDKLQDLLDALGEAHTINYKLADSAIITGDRNCIGQVITNLMSNAIKYSPGADEILVSCAIIKENVKICVEDFGFGIPSNYQSKIFERFFRANHDSKQNTFPGLGLGLYISSQIIKKHAGNIEFHSVDNIGSTFCFTLPLQSVM